MNVRSLREHHGTFLAFVKSRVGSDAEAEELLQSAFVRAVESAGELRDESALLPWFYRILRNVVVDHHRRRAAERRALERLEREPCDGAVSPLDGSTASVCTCVEGLLHTLRPKDGDLLRQVDLADRPVHAVATEQGISAGSARARLHRARRALRERVRSRCGACADEGCLECTCGRDRESGPGARVL